MDSPWVKLLSLPDKPCKTESDSVQYQSLHDKPFMQNKTQFSSLIYKSWPAFINLPLAGTVVANV
ncbi:hypothetical protein SLEP1_g58399 [Rubroshorea leprosula]|uniref:Uncharacterized protein n=1 Tax=Rubroshorea leprosula TaxID=152421 RepID=A0AAV5MRZ4_9ROSI|nr:hypothetical protein SLEP1_g58399 [Rubroshorea leprosula]